MHNIDENEVLRDALSGLNEDVPPMPEGLHAAWMQKVEEDMEEKRTEKTLNRKALTRFLSVAAAVVFVVGGTILTRDHLPAPGSDALVAYTRGAEPQSEDSARWTSYDGDMAVSENYTLTAGSGTRTISTNGSRSAAAPAMQADSAATEKKIIRTASMTLRTQAYDASLASLRSLCESSGGWVENSRESTNTHSGLRTASMTLRIPQSVLDAFLTGTEGCGRITARSETATDVTAAYQDTQTRLETQLALMDRLQALIPESASLGDLLALESQIADTQYQIDTLTASLQETDRQVDYATVSITLYEETAPELTDTTVSLGERIGAALTGGFTALADFLQDMLVFLVAALPFLAIVAIIVIVVFIVRRFRRRNAK